MLYEVCQILFNGGLQVSRIDIKDGAMSWLLINTADQHECIYCN